MDSTDLEFSSLNIESKLPMQNIFQFSNFFQIQRNSKTLDNREISLEQHFSNPIPQASNFNLDQCQNNQRENIKKEYDQLETKQNTLNKLLLLNIDEVPSKVNLSKTSLTYSPNKDMNLATSPDKKEPLKAKINILTTIKNVTMAVKKLKGNTIFKSANYLTDKQIDIVNDNAFCHDNIFQSKDQIRLLLAKSKASRMFYKWKIYIINSLFFQKAREFKSNLIKRIPIIEPDHKWKIIWDLSILFLYLCLFFVMGLQISFDIIILEEIFPENRNGQKFFQVLINIVFFVDILMKCLTAYYQNGILVKVVPKIIKNYISKHLLYDFLAIIPIFIETGRVLTFESHDRNSPSFNIIVKLSQFLIYFKFFEFVNALDILDDILQLEERSEALFNLVKLIIEILLFCHFIACAWHAVASYSPYEINMLEVDDLYHKKWFSQYLTFLFWTISWEKLEPKNNLEYGFGFFAVLASHAVFGFIIEGIHSILESLGKKNAEMKKDIRTINKFMDNKNIGYDLQMKIRKYFYFMHEHKVTNSLLENEVIGKLSNSLKEEVLIKAHGESLLNVPLFSKNFSQATMRKLILSMKKLSFYPEEMIFKQGDISNSALYLITDGQIDLFLEFGDNISTNRLNSMYHLKKREFFGETSFLTGSRRLCSAISVSFSTVYVIEREDFLKIVSERQPDFEKYCQIRDKIAIYSNFDDLQKKCNTCLKRDHTMFTCPEIHYVPRKDFIIKRYLYSEPILSRFRIKRKGSKAPHALKTINLLRQKLPLFESLAPRKEIEEFSDGEFSETELNDVPESPTNSNFKKKANNEQFSFSLHPITEESIQKASDDETKDKLEDEFVLRMRKKDTGSFPYSSPKHQVSSKEQLFKKTTSLQSRDQFNQQQFWDYNFDKMHVFTQYFVENNSDSVLRKYEQQVMKKIMRKQKLKQIKRKKTRLLSQFSPNLISPDKKKEDNDSSSNLKKREECDVLRSGQNARVNTIDPFFSWNMDGEKVNMI